MAIDHTAGRLDLIPVDRIVPNPDNPRVAFRQSELDDLQESIRQFGIQVPIAVFKRGRDYVLIDGERRWKCASKLNLKEIPALIQQQPGELQNLLLMFNIHALREQWDLLTIALKLPTIIRLLKHEIQAEPTESEISAKTGLSRGVIRRCKLLIELPKRYLDLLLNELKKPKTKQTLSEDLFIEIERSLKTVARAMPGLIQDKNQARDILIAKYQANVISNIVDFRKIAKIARAESVKADTSKAKTAIQKLFTDPRYSIEQAWGQSVSEAYAERDIASRIETLLSKLEEVAASELDDDIRDKLEELIDRAQVILGVAK